MISILFQDVLKEIDRGVLSACAIFGIKSSGYGEVAKTGSLKSAYLLQIVGVGFVCALLAQSAQAQGLFGNDNGEGRVVSVRQQAVLRSGGETTPLSVGQTVRVGDDVATGRNGTVEIEFPDQTRVVVAPNSQIEITRALFRENNRARRLSISALRGSFRFLSGDSNSSAYRLRTPTGTLGVRGTAFDVAVEYRESMDMVVYNGEVRVCAPGSRCGNVPGNCSTMALDRNGVFTQPRTLAERATQLEKFPFVRNQGRLSPAFRVDTSACFSGQDEFGDGDEIRIRQLRLPPAPPNDALSDSSTSISAPRSRPAPQAPPAPPPEDREEQSDDPVVPPPPPLQ